MAYIGSPLVQKVFDIAKRKRKLNILHHRQADDLWAGFEVLERGKLGHGQKLRRPPARLKASFFGKTVARYRNRDRVCALQLTSQP